MSEKKEGKTIDETQDIEKLKKAKLADMVVK